MITFTDAAAAKVYDLIAEEGDLELKLRVFITGGGCSGFQYGFTFDKAVSPDDTAISTSVTDQQGQVVPVQLLVDPMSLQYLVGAKIDYRKDLQGEQFVISNPNVKTTCGCGSSFSA